MQPSWLVYIGICEISMGFLVGLCSRCGWMGIGRSDFLLVCSFAVQYLGRLCDGPIVLVLGLLLFVGICPSGICVRVCL